MNDDLKCLPAMILGFIFFAIGLIYICIAVCGLTPSYNDNKEQQQIKGHRRKVLIINSAIVLFSGLILAIGGLQVGFIPIGILGLVGSVVQLIYGIKQNKEVKNGFIRQREEAMRKAQSAQYDDLAQKLYKKCRENGITQDDVYNGTKAFMLIAGCFSIQNRNEAAECYSRGKELAGKEDIAIYNKNRQNEINIAFESYNNAQIIGKDKYLQRFYKELNEINRQKGINQAQQILNDSIKLLRPTYHDPAIAGGLMDGLFGTGAGVYTAMNVQNSNVQSQMAHQQRQLECAVKDSEIRQAQGRLRIEEDNLMRKYKYRQIVDKLVDCSNPEVKFKMLDISKLKCEVTDYKNIVVTGEVKLKCQLKILNSDAALDGSLLIKVFNSKKEIVGVGYYCAGGFGETNLKTVGFNDTLENRNSRKINTMCYIENTNLVNKNETYSAIAEPYRLWLIET